MIMEISDHKNNIVARYDNRVIKTCPAKTGEDSQFPTPFSMFIASIGTCTAYYVFSYCKTKKIPTENIRLILDTKENENSKLIENIEITIDIPDNISNKEINIIKNVAEKCKVKKQILNSPDINIIVNT